MASEIHLSVVIPVYNEQESIPELSHRLTEVCRSLKKGHEILFVDDGSSDGTLEAIRGVRKTDRNIAGLSLAKNSGKANAYAAGFDAARGEVVITMDGDLQDRPEQIPEFLAKIDEGYDLVTGWKYTGKGKRTWSSRLFNRLVRAWTKLDIHDTNCPFKAYRREVVKNLKVYGTLYRFIPALAYWKGYRVAEIKVENDPRKHGATKYGPGRFLGGFFDLLTVTFLTQYIKRPLHFFGLAGLVLGSAGFFIDLAIVIKGLISGRVGHQAMLLLGLVLIIIGVQFIFAGLLAEMLFRLYQEQGREVPVYRRLDG
ncbi:MAG TPA: glycosyltransferase [candidate division Zixibacteria bacterium]|jgi:glycosyltransferase involved in cell wall biosynthesis|nr:glycosyltransferase [candidate division Zixibacteria bacterium]